MSGIIVLPIIVPAISAAWPFVLAAAGSAASSLGYAAARTKTKTSASEACEVNIELPNSDSVTDTMALGEEVVFSKDDIKLIFSRNASGKICVKALGKNKSEAELKKVAKEFADAVTKQYAYHKIIKELKQRNLNIVGQEIDADGTVRLQVRTYQS